MERSIKPATEAASEVLWETPHYVIVRGKLPKDNTETPSLAVFLIVDKEHKVVWGARSGFGGAKIAACMAEAEHVTGGSMADAQLQRGWQAGSDEDGPIPPFGLGGNSNAIN